MRDNTEYSAIDYARSSYKIDASCRRSISSIHVLCHMLADIVSRVTRALPTDPVA